MFDIAGIISRIFVFLIAVSVHEFAHAYVAFTQGDTTARDTGRMTLDPRANIWWPGFLIGVLMGFAIMGSAPVNPYRMRNPRWGMLLAVGAGPVSNLLLAAFFAIFFRLGIAVFDPFGSVNDVLPTPDRILSDMVWLNVLLFVFNLLPLYPLDGWTVALSLLPTGAAIWWERNKQNSMYVLFGLVFLSFAASYLGGVLARFNPMSYLIGLPANQITYLLIGY